LDLNKILDGFNYNGTQILPEFNPSQLLEELSKGNLQIDSKGIFKKILAYFMKEVNSNMKIIIKVIIIGILCAMLKNLQENFGGSTGDIAFYACYLLMVTLIMLGFKDAISVGQSAIFDMVSFMQAMIPVLITLMTTTGNIVSTSALYPVIILVVEVVSSTLGTFMVPIIYLVAALSIISNISDKIQLSKLAGLIKTISVWMMGIILTLFVSVVTIEANLGATIDGVTGKAVKFAFSKSIPVVGQTLSDAVETVLGCSVIIRNSVGVVGTILILGIILAPLIKILALMLMYKFAAVLVEPVADARIVRCLNDVGGTLTLLFAIVVSVGFMFIIAITTLVKTGAMAAAIR
jgi:stage III sporulation protein AE